MSVNKKKARKPVALNKAQQTAMAGVTHAAFNAGQAREQAIATTAAALGKRPGLALYNAGKLALQVGFMAAALARKGDNRPTGELLKHCHSRLTEYAGATAAKVGKSQKGRRTAAEEAAYGSARVQVTGIMKAAGVTVPGGTGGGDTSKTRNASAKAKAKAKAKPETRPVARTFKSADSLVEYALIQAKALQGTWNKSAKVGPARLGKAIAAFTTEVMAVADEAKG